MNLINTIEDLVRFKTITGNAAEIDKCLDYIAKSFEGTAADVKIERFQNVSPVIYIANNKSMQQDVLILGHIDVVAATDDMFEPKIKDGKMYGRGTLDMKSFAAVAMNSMHYVLEHQLPIHFAIILSSDEEQGSKSTHAFLERYSQLTAKVVLDNDVGGDITKIINKCKNPVFVKLTAKGLAAHGSTPWEGLDANEMLMKTIYQLRKFYPYFDVNGGAPENTWIDTMHVAKINGGEVSNIISSQAEALLDIRLTETSSLEELENNLKACLASGVEYKIVSSSTPVVMTEDNPQIAAYKKFAEQVMGCSIEFQQIGGATDARLFAQKGATVIMHSGTGEGMHAAGEYVVVQSVKDLAQLQIEYLKSLRK
ncbi:MAG: M20/M25/M40 family metallo-hydrolase [Alphaproteobacteria bacterium]|nr:M20/M25/M40 family metallo-hydrolase [Alphaproteobacteria bacterium]